MLRKLALNEDENPYLVAQRFIEQEELPPYFQEQVGGWYGAVGPSCRVGWGVGGGGGG